MRTQYSQTSYEHFPTELDRVMSARNASLFVWDILVGQ